MQRLINHDYEKDITEFPQYYHSINFIICHKDFNKEFVSDISNKLYITAEKDFAENSNSILIKSEYDTTVMRRASIH